ncbi:Predicted acetyltransferase, GNAT superfamily [Saccharopolyspora antimicrobica]|uniref:GNAT superfamily acetyltransferase n=1 Tax=Saccharopolyspora antimicrobica TaxID=455193 RepID=A0A1I4R1C2_9PSEU|nr:GNAT family N-acetyltransferase [Saccharopolyspora antimicrobica]RKT88210.1 putative GNAT superfamily acetyltransferase [Saccharopolyspora antimicrobica]SFM46057.1 Predicted acetyltransferase, GNAT superfamily [Saccharopolyspora antimicrobica]
MGRGPASGLRAADFVVRDLDTAELQRQAAALYRRVFGYRDSDVGLSPPLLTALLRNGGSVVGAVDADGALLGFAYGMRGGDGTRMYHYSQAAVVAPESQGLGLGRKLKQAQAAVARNTGMRYMRWSYDPLISRNAHFNLDVLGAAGRWYVDDFYLHEHSDRVVVEWDLEGSPAPFAPAEPNPPVTRADWGTWQDFGAHGRLVLPSDPALLEPDRAAGVRSAVRAGFHEFLARGLVARSCRQVSAETSVYWFARIPITGGDHDRA